MAYTSIIPVHRLDNSITYVRDKDKTTKKTERAGSLEGAIDYALNREKTEQMVFEDAIGCTCESAYADMTATKGRFHKKDGVQGYHLIQSFAKGEVTPELAHLIGLELAEELLKGRFEAVITTHLNTDHYHNHIVFNSVSMTDGRKYHSNSRSYYEDVRGISDRLCRKYGLSIISPSGEKGKSYGEWEAEQRGKPTWRTGIRMDIREAVQMSFTWKQFLHQMELKGYEWKLNRKYIALKAPGMERFIRLRSLGKNYTEQAIREWILQPGQDKDVSAGKSFLVSVQKPKKKATGLQALYYFYMYRLGIWGKPRAKSRYSLRGDIRKLDQRLEQLAFLQTEGITTREQLESYRKPLEEQMIALVRERRKLYRTDPEAKRIQEIGEQLKPIRKKVKMCSQIEVHSLEMEERLRQMEAWEAERTQKQEMKETQEHRKER